MTRKPRILYSADGSKAGQPDLEGRAGWQANVLDYRYAYRALLAW